MNGLANDIKNRYRCKVIECRLAAGIAKKKQLAASTGIPATVISDLEAGKLFLSSAYALRICEVLNCRIDDLFERIAVRDEPKNDTQ